MTLTVIGSFEQLLVLGVLARFGQYVPTCLAVLVFRARPDHDPDAGYNMPFGPVIPVTALMLCGWLLANQDPQKLKVGAYALAAGVPLYFISKFWKPKGQVEGISS